MKPEYGYRILAALHDGPKKAAELARILCVSQPTLSRQLAKLGREILPLGKGKAACYARMLDLRGMGSRFPLHSIDENGDASLLGEVIVLTGGSFAWMPVNGLYSLYRHLPWFIEDMRPEGFIGRAFATRLSSELHLPQRLGDWNSEHLLTALACRGEDCMGNLILGEESLRRYFARSMNPGSLQSSVDTDKEYPQLAAAALAGEPAGSSAGGEQPKFTVAVADNGLVRNLLVKFSPPLATAEGRRWGDLLLCEHIALDLIAKTGYRASRSFIKEIEGRIYLEVERFDRAGRWGRRRAVSLGSIDAEFFGQRDNWIAASRRLENSRMISAEDATALRWLSAFSAFIANVDQHFGNISLLMPDSNKLFFKLAPAYDILPMLYRPDFGIENTLAFSPPVALMHAIEVFESARNCGLLFWETAAGDQRISESFRGVCRENIRIIKKTADSPKLR